MSLTQAQLAARKIGSSDAAVALGWSPWEDAYSWWLKRTGKEDPEPESLPMRHGTHCEPLVGQLFKEASGMGILPVEQIDGPRDFMTANLDFAVWGPNPLIPIECKTANVFKVGDWPTQGSDQIEDFGGVKHYVAQLHHQMACTGADHGYLAVLIGNAEFRWYRLARNDDLIADLIRAEERLWRCVQEDDPPMPETWSSQSIAWPESVHAKRVEADDDILAEVLAINEERRQIAEIEERMKARKVKVRGYMEDGEVLVYGDTKLADWKTNKAGKRPFRVKEID